MLLKIAWRNLWRNKRRSVIVIISITVGLIATILTDTLSMGFLAQMLDNQVRSSLAHIQIHKKGFNDNKTIQNSISNPLFVEDKINQVKGIEHYSVRVISFGLLSSATASSGILINGINPEQEQFVTNIKQSIVKGKYLDGGGREIIIGTELAKKLGVGVGDKVVAMATALGGDIGSDVFRIVGLYKTFSSDFDKSTMFIPLQSAQKMLNLGNKVSSFAIIVKDTRQVDEIKNNLIDHLGGNYEVLTYKDIMPLLIMQLDLFKQSMLVFYFIIGLALIFGITNTMLMAVFERINEFGVLMSIGMKNSRIFIMIILEALFLGIVGTIIGMAAGLLIYWPLSYSGINLSAFSTSLSAWGTGNIIYPVLYIEGFLNAIFIVPFISVIAAIYPAIKAIRLEPIYAIRYI
jgi:putative ABC transport system permease protein